jgi:hypothetical protein
VATIRRREETSPCWAPGLTDWKRIALVTDIDWMIRMAAMFGWMTPGELKRFPLAERDAAIAWAAAGD